MMVSSGLKRHRDGERWTGRSQKSEALAWLLDLLEAFSC